MAAALLLLSAVATAGNARDSAPAFDGASVNVGNSRPAIGRNGSLTLRWRGEDANTVWPAVGADQEILTIVVGPRP